MSRIRKFQWPSGLVIPKNSRTVSQPIEKSSLRVITDLIPTQAITESWPAQNSTYGELPYCNQTDDRRFANHKFYRLLDREGDFTRAVFVPRAEDVDSNTAIDTIWTYDSSVYWPPIVESVDFFTDIATLPGGVGTEYHGESNSTWLIFVKRRPAYRGITKLRIQQFVSAVNPFDFSATQQQNWTLTNVQWNLGGVNGRGETGECLHPDIVVPGTNMLDAAVYVWNATDPGGRPVVIGSDYTSRLFKATGGIEDNVGFGSVNYDWLWEETFVLSDSVTPKGGVYLREIVTAYRPYPEDNLEEYYT
jgi:hypothetical protein